MQRFYFSEPFSKFLSQSDEFILGSMDAQNEFDLTIEQRGAWVDEFEIMKNVVRALPGDGQILFEYTIPRLGKRVDVVLLYKGIVFAIEFKVGADEFLANDKEQVWDYALDLKNFHEESRDRIIVPILVATEAPDAVCSVGDALFCYYDDHVYNPLLTNASKLLPTIERILQQTAPQAPLDAHEWTFSRYSPTPTIIQAASALYMNHSVEDITRHEADKAGIDSCTAFILDVIRQSKQNHEKSICFVTGVPGAGKTLVGLNVAIQQEEGDLAVYLSGNGPLVKVLTEALARDKVQKEKAKGRKCTKTEAERQVSRFIQIIHRYRDNMLGKLKLPIRDAQIELDPAKVSKAAGKSAAEVENVAIFDEAQRMWDMRHLSAWLARKKGVNDFPMSEGEFLIWSLDQHKDWATVVCLVGGGQEINSGEGGIGLWIDALNQRFPDWKIYISNRLNYIREHPDNLIKYKEVVLDAVNHLKKELIVDFAETNQPLSYLEDSLYGNILVFNGGGSSEKSLCVPYSYFKTIRRISDILPINFRQKEIVGMNHILSNAYGLSFQVDDEEHAIKLHPFDLLLKRYKEQVRDARAIPEHHDKYEHGLSEWD